MSFLTMQKRKEKKKRISIFGNLLLLKSINHYHKKIVTKDLSMTYHAVSVKYSIKK